MSASDVAIATIKMEHRSLGTVLQTLREFLKRIVAGHTPADFGLLSAALHYIDDFPERCHHPKEEAHLFRRLRTRTAELNPVLERLQGEHVRSAAVVSELHRRLVLYQAGAAGALRYFQDAVDNHAADMLAHFLVEDDVLARARNVLTEEDWEHVAEAFAANDDPLFGSNHRAEFAHLYRRIMLLSPQKLRRGLPGD